MKCKLLYFLGILLVSGCNGGNARLLPDCAGGMTHSGKFPTEQWPAVGRFVLEVPGMGSRACTATLTAPAEALTAAHCVGYTSGSYGVEAYVMLGGQRRHVYAWQSARGEGAINDYATLFFSKPVRGIEPMTVVGGQPPADAVLVFVGYGCKSACISNTGVAKYSGAGEKRVGYLSPGTFSFEGPRDPRFFICPGDSGGPVLDPATGSVYAVASRVSRTKSFFGNPRPTE